MDKVVGMLVEIQRQIQGTQRTQEATEAQTMDEVTAVDVDMEASTAKISRSMLQLHAEQQQPAKQAVQEREEVEEERRRE